MSQGDEETGRRGSDVLPHASINGDAAARRRSRCDVHRQTSSDLPASPAPCEDRRVAALRVGRAVASFSGAGSHDHWRARRRSRGRVRRDVRRDALLPHQLLPVHRALLDPDARQRDLPDPDAPSVGDRRVPTILARRARGRGDRRRSHARRDARSRAGDVRCRPARALAACDAKRKARPRGGRASPYLSRDHRLLGGSLVGRPRKSDTRGAPPRRSAGARGAPRAGRVSRRADRVERDCLARR